MPIAYDDEEGFVVIPDDCPDCNQPLCDTGCDAPGCPGRCCMDCGTGCDLDFLGDEGECARAIADESPEDHLARVNRERAAFGLSPVGE